MSDYGQSIPNRVLQLSNINNVSKSKFAQIFCQGLVEVGMKFIAKASTYDVLNPANAEVGQVNNSGGEIDNFLFDFPTNEYFTVGTLKYRPCIIVNGARQDFGPGYYGNNNYNAFSIRVGMRRWDRWNLSDLRSWWYYRVDGGNFGIGSPGSGSPSVIAGAALRYKDGTAYEASDPRWLPFIGALANGSPQNYYTRNFANFYMYLGTAGLFVFVGSDTSKTGFGSWMSYGAAFGMGRIPGRALIPNQDVNLPRIFPILELPMHNGVDADYWDGTTLRANLIGMQFDLKQKPNAQIVALAANLENVEEPIYPSFVPNVLRSPRVINGSGAYVLSRVVIIPKYDRANSADLMGPVNTQIVPNDTRPQWTDLFTCPNFRFGDRTVTPHQEYVDPVDSQHWFIVYAQNTNMAYAIDYTARTLINAIALTRTVISTIPIDLSVGGFAGPFPAEVISVTSTNPSGAPPPWTPTPGQNEALITSNGVTYSNKDLTVILQPNPADPDDVVYELSIDLKHTVVTTTSPSSEYLQLFVYDAANNALQVVLMYADANPLSPQQNYRTFKANLQPIISQSNQLQFLVRYYNAGYNDQKEPGLRNMVVTKIRYTPT